MAANFPRLRLFRTTRIKRSFLRSLIPRRKAADFRCCDSKGLTRMLSTSSARSKARRGQELRRARPVRGGCATACNWNCAETFRQPRSGWIVNDSRWEQRRISAAWFGVANKRAVERPDQRKSLPWLISGRNRSDCESAKKHFVRELSAFKKAPPAVRSASDCHGFDLTQSESDFARAACRLAENFGR